MDDLKAKTARLADPAFFLTPEFDRLLAYLRQTSPVHWCLPWPQRGFWAVSRHADIKSVYEQPLLFSNEAAGNIIPADPELYLGDRDALGFGATTSNSDPPLHGQLRRLFSRALSGPQVGKLEALCQQVVDEILAEVQGRDRLDFVADIAAHLPARLICLLLGVPREDWPMISGYANSFASFSDPELQLGASPAETFQIAMKATFDYVSDLVAERRLNPQDDFATMAALGEIDGQPISHRLAAWSAWSLLAAGFETSRNVIAGGLLALLEHPDQFDVLKSQPGLIHSAVDEMVRWTMPATATLRVATADARIAGQPIRQGDWVVLFIHSANRDEAVFTEAHRFDIARRPNPYLSFGHGIHNCLGRMLALLEVRVMIRTLIEHCDRIELAGPLDYCASTIAKGVKHMPVDIGWKARASSDDA